MEISRSHQNLSARKKGNALSNSTILIADLSGPGSPDDLDTWAREIELALSGDPALERVARYRKFNLTNALVLFELKGTDVDAIRAKVPLRSAPYTIDFVALTELRAHKRKDAIKDPRDLPLLFPVAFPVPPEREAALADWYDNEHLPMLLGCPYWAMSRRFRVADGAPKRWEGHLALHYLSDAQALRAPEREAARSTAWRDRLAAEPWFRATYALYLQERPAGEYKTGGKFAASLP